jgi:TPR repeat protein
MKNEPNRLETGIKKMARFEIRDIEMAAAGGETRADVFCNLGLIYATGRGCPVDMVAAHKWLNIAAIKGSDRAASLRSDLARNMSKSDLAQALRAAREWMTMH